MKIGSQPNNKQKRIAVCSWIAGLLVPIFFLTTIWRGDLAFAVTGSLNQTSDVPILKSLKALVLPETYGRLEETFESTENAPKIILIQDAHAIPDAQRSIRHILLYLQKRYGIRQVAVEGAAQKLDPQMFTSYPDKKELAKVLRVSMDRGELSGSVAAALMGISNRLGATGTQPDYFGVEDWKLYEEGLELYLKGMSGQDAALKLIDAEFANLKIIKKQKYSKQLLSVDLAEVQFRENNKDLMEFFKILAAVKPPKAGSEIALFLAESDKHADEQEGLEKEVRQIVEDFKPRLDRLTPENRLVFNQKWQSFQTGEIHADQFALTLKEMAVREKIEIPMSGTLLRGAQTQKRLSDIEGTDFFKALEDFTREVKESLFMNAEDRQLDRETHALLLQKKLAMLELSREQWLEIKAASGGRPADIEIERLIKDQFDFYENAEARDRIFFDKLKKRAKAGETMVMIAGGFHAQGLMERFKKAGISYALVMPQIDHLPERSNYRAHMQGDVSWKSYFRVEKGRINLYEPFVRYTRDQLLDQAQGVGAYGHTPLLLKSWRDQLIRDLARAGRIEEAGKYTRFLDEKIRRKDSNIQDRLRKLEKFFDGLRKLDREGRFQAPNILQLLKPATVPAGPVAGALTDVSLAVGAMSEVRQQPASEVKEAADLVVGDFVTSGPRSEMRASKRSSKRSEVRISESKTILPRSLEEAVEAKRALIQSDQADAIDELLFQRFGDRYVRVTLRHQGDLDRLISKVHIEKGEIDSSEGPLMRIIREGGVLLIDYAGSDPKLVDGLNKLLDVQNASYRGISVNAELNIIGVVNQPIDTFDTPFKRRYSKKMRLETLPYKDPLADESRFKAPVGLRGILADLDESPEVEETLLGKTYFDEMGRLSLEKTPVFLQALSSGLPLILRGASLYRNPELARFLRQLLLRREYSYNGKTEKLPEGFQIYLEEGDYAKQKPMDKFFVPGFFPSETVYAVNSVTRDLLFAKTFANESGLLAQDTGILQQKGQALNLLITEDLPDWVWHKILKSPGKIYIQVQHGVEIPAVYRDFIEEQLKENRGTMRESPRSWDAAVSAILQGDDTAVIRQGVHVKFEGQEVIEFFAGPQTSASDLMESLGFPKGRTQEGQPVQFSDKAFLKALERGAVVILEGLEGNESLQRSLESLLIENAYYMKNGVHHFLSETGARVFVLTRNPLAVSAAVTAKVSAEQDPASVKEILQQEFSNRFQGEHSDSFEKIQQLTAIFQGLPRPRKAGDYSETFSLDLERMRQLYRFSRWSQAFERHVISQYEAAPEVAAFMRVMVRIIFGEENGSPNSVDEERAMTALNRTVGGTPKEQNFWKFAESLSTDLLQQTVRPELGFNGQNTQRVFELLGLAFAQDARTKGDGVLEAYYRLIFDLDEETDFSKSPVLAFSAKRSEREARSAETQQIATDLEVAKVAFFQGPPGSSKSYSATAVARKLGFNPETQVVRVTTGRDASYGEVIAQQGIDATGKTFLIEGAVARWANLKEGGVLQVDEANLPKGVHFWNFLKGLFAQRRFVDIDGERVFLTDRHFVIFTGNENVLEGRHEQEFLRDFAMTIPFHPFSVEFLRQEALVHLKKLERETKRSKQNLPGLEALIVDLHTLFNKPHAGRDFSIRDVLELVERSFYQTDNDWSVEQIILLAWDQYSGFFDADERDALFIAILTRFGVNIRTLNYKKRIEENVMKLGKSQSFKESGIVLTDSISEVLAAVQIFLNVTQAHVRTARAQPKNALEKYKSLGKKGMLIEGHAGRGKDAALIALFEALGIPYEHISASLDTEELEAAIKRAMTQGSVLLVSELNLLDSAYLEGKLNDVLTGDAADGFAFFATINSSDFSGREKLSTALQNRLLYHRLDDYSPAEFTSLAYAKKGEVPQYQADLLVNTHLWILQSIAQPSRRPSAAELLQALALMRDRGYGVYEAVTEVYGLGYLEGILGEARMPSTKEWQAEELKAAGRKKESGFVRMLKLVAEMIIPREKGPVTLDTRNENNPNAAGYYVAAGNLIHMEPRVFENGHWLSTLLHEASHGLFTRGDISPGFISTMIIDDFEDLRHTAAFDRLYPHAGISAAGEELKRFALAAANPTTGMVDLSAWMQESKNPLTARLLFRIALMAYGKKLLTWQQFEDFTRNWTDPEGKQTLALALKVLAEVEIIAAAIPENLTENEIRIHQFRAFTAMRAIAKEYEKIGQVKADVTGNTVAPQKPGTNLDLSAVTASDMGLGLAAAALANTSVASRRPGVYRWSLSRDSVERFFKAALKVFHRISRMTLLLSTALTAIYFVIQFFTAHVVVLPSAPSIQSGPDISSEVQSSPWFQPDLFWSQPWYVYAGVFLLFMALSIMVLKWFFPQRMRRFAGEMRRLGGKGLRVHRGEGSRSGAALGPPTNVAGEVLFEVLKNRFPRKPKMQRMSGLIQRDLVPVFREFSTTRIQSDRVYGPTGTIDISRYAAGVPPSSLFRKSGGVSEPVLMHLKVGIKTGRAGSNNFDELGHEGLVEFLHLYEEMGGKVTLVYGTEPFRGVKMTGSSAFIYADELAEQIEPLYAYGLVSKRIQDGKVEEAHFEKLRKEGERLAKQAGLTAQSLRVLTWKDLDSEEKNAHWSLSLDPEVEAWGDWAKLRPLRTRVTRLDIRDSQVTDVSPVIEWPALEALDISKTGVKDLSPLFGLPIASVVLPDTISEHQIQKLFERNPLKSFHIRISDRYYTPARGSYALQDRWRRFEALLEPKFQSYSWSWGDSFIKMDPSRATFFLDLANSRAVDMFFVKFNGANARKFFELMRGMPFLRGVKLSHHFWDAAARQGVTFQADILPMLQSTPGLEELEIRLPHYAETSWIADIYPLKRLKIHLEDRGVHDKRTKTRAVDLAGLAAKHGPTLESLSIRSPVMPQRIDQISNFPHLKELNLSPGYGRPKTPLAGFDLSLLEKLSELESLHLHALSILDSAVLPKIHSLKELRLWNVTMEMPDLSTLENLRSLEVLGNVKIDNLDFLAGITRLESLSIHADQVTTLEPLSRLAHLQELELDTPQIRDLTPLAGLSGLRSVKLEVRGVNGIKALEGKNLKRLIIRTRGARTYEPFGDIFVPMISAHPNPEQMGLQIGGANNGWYVDVNPVTPQSERDKDFSLRLMAPNETLDTVLNRISSEPLAILPADYKHWLVNNGNERHLSIHSMARDLVEALRSEMRSAVLYRKESKKEALATKAMFVQLLEMDPQTVWKEDEPMATRLLERSLGESNHVGRIDLNAGMVMAPVGAPEGGWSVRFTAFHVVEGLPEFTLELSKTEGDRETYYERKVRILREQKDRRAGSTGSKLLQFAFEKPAAKREIKYRTVLPGAVSPEKPSKLARQMFADLLREDPQTDWLAKEQLETQRFNALRALAGTVIGTTDQGGRFHLTAVGSSLDYLISLASNSKTGWQIRIHAFQIFKGRPAFEFELSQPDGQGDERKIYRQIQITRQQREIKNNRGGKGTFLEVKVSDSTLTPQFKAPVVAPQTLSEKDGSQKKLTPNEAMKILVTVERESSRELILAKQQAATNLEGAVFQTTNANGEIILFRAGGKSYFWQVLPAEVKDKEGWVPRINIVNVTTTGFRFVVTLTKEMDGVKNSKYAIYSTDKKNSIKAGSANPESFIVIQRNARLTGAPPMDAARFTGSVYKVVKTRKQRAKRAAGRIGKIDAFLTSERIIEAIKALDAAGISLSSSSIATDFSAEGKETLFNAIGSLEDGSYLHAADVYASVRRSNAFSPPKWPTALSASGYNPYAVQKQLDWSEGKLEAALRAIADPGGPGTIPDSLFGVHVPNRLAYLTAMRHGSIEEAYRRLGLTVPRKFLNDPGMLSELPGQNELVSLGGGDNAYRVVVGKTIAPAEEILIGHELWSVVDQVIQTMNETDQTIASALVSILHTEHGAPDLNSLVDLVNGKGISADQEDVKRVFEILAEAPDLQAWSPEEDFEEDAEAREIAPEIQRSEMRGLTDEGGLPAGLQEALEAKRTLIQSEQVDAIDALLFHQFGSRYVRVTLRNQEDLDRLITRVKITAGHIAQPEGPLMQIIRGGGVLLIDYAGSNPKVIDGLNKLLDTDNASYQGVAVNSGLKIIGVVKAPLFTFDTPFKRRYANKKMRLEHVSVSDPLERSWSAPADVETLSVDLDDNPDVEEVLLGRSRYDAEGRLTIEAKPPLIDAVERGLPLRIRGASLQRNAALAIFLRRLLLTRHYEYNGESRELPRDFKIYLEDVDASGLPDTKVFVSGFEPGSKVEVINREIQGTLFEKNVTRSGRLAELPGLLEADGAELSLLITENLPDWVWHRIFKSQRNLRIQLQSGVQVPALYREYAEARKDTQSFETQPFPAWTEAPSAHLFGEDAAFVRQTIRDQFAGREVAEFFISPQMDVNDLLESLEFTQGAAGQAEPLKHYDAKEILRALKRGAVVVLEGLENNESLQRSLESLLQEAPYFVENGERHALSEFGARVIVVSRNPLAVRAAVRANVRTGPGQEDLKGILQKEFPARFQGADQDSFEKIMKLAQLFENLPKPRGQKTHPENLTLNLARLRQLYRFDHWIEAFESMVISDYVNAPEIAAFMRVMVRFEFAEGVVPARSVDRLKVRAALNRSVGTLPLEKNFWQFADALSPDLLHQMLDFNKGLRGQDQAAVLLLIGQALLQDAQSRGDHDDEAYYREKFQIGAVTDLTQAALVITPPVKSERELRADELTRIANHLEKVKVAFFQGSPGTGKSYSVAEVSRLLGFDPATHLVRVTTGRDAAYGDVVAQQGLDKNGNTVTVEGAVARWAKLKSGGVLQVDEANLPKGAHFWDFFQGLFAPKPFVDVAGERIFLTDKHLVIFTGNEDFLEGRHAQDFLRDYAMTVAFQPFSEGFLRKEAQARLAQLGRLTQTTKQNLPELAKRIVELHAFFDRINGGRNFSIRDVLELTERAHFKTPAAWTLEDVVLQAWDQYSGFFDTQEKLALAYQLLIQFGVDVRKLHGKRTQAGAKKYAGTKSFRDRGVVITDSMAEVLTAAEAFLDLTQTHADTAAGQPANMPEKHRSLGKKGMIIEGASGRGKDIGLAALFDALGVRYEHISASMDYEELEMAIKRAMEQGTVLLVSELNLLDSALLEGKLNDVLTGDAKEGFAFFATINSSDYSGRERLSTALQNRLLYHRLEDYTPDEFEVLAQQKRGSVPEAQALKLMKFHLWLREQIVQPGKKPSAAEFLQALELMRERGFSADRAALEIYGLGYLEGVFGTIRLPVPEELLLGWAQQKLREQAQNRRVLELIAEMIIPREKGPVTIDTRDEQDPHAAGYYVEDQNLIHVEPNNFLSGNWLSVLLHESSHGLFTRHGVFSGSISTIIFDDFEDLRHTAAFDQFFPHAHISAATPGSPEFKFAEAAQAPGAGAAVLRAWMQDPRDPLTPRLLLRIALIAYGKKLVTRAQMQAFAAAWRGKMQGDPLDLAVSLLDQVDIIAAALPQTLEEEEIKFQQFRAARAMQVISEKYEGLNQVKADEGLPAPWERPAINPDLSAVALDLSSSLSASLAAPQIIPRLSSRSRLFSSPKLYLAALGSRLLQIFRAGGRVLAWLAGAGLFIWLGSHLLPYAQGVYERHGIGVPWSAAQGFSSGNTAVWLVTLAVLIGIAYGLVDYFSETKIGMWFSRFEQSGVHRGEGKGSHDIPGYGRVHGSGNLPLVTVKSMYRRSAEMQRVSERIQLDLLHSSVIQELSSLQTQADRIYGPAGRPDVRRIARKAPPRTLFRKAGGALVPVMGHLKVIMNVGRIQDGMSFDQLEHFALREFLYWFEAQGGTVSLVYGVPPVAATRITGSTVSMNASDLAERLEPYYAYGLVRERMDQTQAEDARVAAKEAALKQLAVDIGRFPDSIGEAPASVAPDPANHFKLVLNADVKSWEWAQIQPFRGQIAAINPIGEHVTSMAPLADWPGLEWIDFSGTAVTDLTPLYGKPFRYLAIPKSIPAEQVDELFRRHPTQQITVRVGNSEYKPALASYSLRRSLQQLWQDVNPKITGRDGFMDIADMLFPVDTKTDTLALDLSYEDAVAACRNLLAEDATRFFTQLRRMNRLTHVEIAPALFDARFRALTFRNTILPLLQRLPNLEELTVELAPGESLDWLAEVPPLKKLTVHYSGDPDLVKRSKRKLDLGLIASRHAQSLETLVVHNVARLEHFEKIGTFQQLKKLRLESNGTDRMRVRDLATLESLPRLETLGLVRISTPNLNAVPRLKGLKSLVIQDISAVVPALAPLVGLKDLFISDAKLDSLNSLKALSHLERLVIYSGAIQDITPIGGLHDLKSLNLQTPKLRDLAPLAALQSLQNVELKVYDISGILGLAGKNLQKLNLAVTGSRDFNLYPDIFEPLVRAHPEPENFNLHVWGNNTERYLTYQGAPERAGQERVEEPEILRPNKTVDQVKERFRTDFPNAIFNPDKHGPWLIFDNGTKKHTLNLTDLPRGLLNDLQQENPVPEPKAKNLHEVYRQILAEIKRNSTPSPGWTLLDLFNHHSIVLMGTRGASGKRLSPALIEDIDFLADRNLLTHLVLPIPEKFGWMVNSALESGNSETLYERFAHESFSGLFGAEFGLEDVGRLITLLKMLSPKVKLVLYPGLPGPNADAHAIAGKLAGIVAQDPNAKILLYDGQLIHSLRTQPGADAAPSSRQIVSFLPAALQAQTAHVLEENTGDWRYSERKAGHNFSGSQALIALDSFGITLKNVPLLAARAHEPFGSLGDGYDALIYRAEPPISAATQSTPPNNARSEMRTAADAWEQFQSLVSGWFGRLGQSAPPMTAKDFFNEERRKQIKTVVILGEPQGLSWGLIRFFPYLDIQKYFPKANFMVTSDLLKMVNFDGGKTEFIREQDLDLKLQSVDLKNTLVIDATLTGFSAASSRLLDQHKHLQLETFKNALVLSVGARRISSFSVSPRNTFYSNQAGMLHEMGFPISPKNIPVLDEDHLSPAVKSTRASFQMLLKKKLGVPYSGTLDRPIILFNPFFGTGSGVLSASAWVDAAERIAERFPQAVLLMHPGHTPEYRKLSGDMTLEIRRRFAGRAAPLETRVLELTPNDHYTMDITGLAAVLSTPYVFTVTVNSGTGHLAEAMDTPRLIFKNGAERFREDYGLNRGSRTDFELGRDEPEVWLKRLGSLIEHSTTTRKSEIRSIAGLPRIVTTSLLAAAFWGQGASLLKTQQGQTPLDEEGFTTVTARRTPLSEIPVVPGQLAPNFVKPVVLRSEMRLAVLSPAAETAVKAELKPVGEKLAQYIYGRVTDETLAKVSERLDQVHKLHDDVTVEKIIEIVREIVTRKIEDIENNEKIKTNRTPANILRLQDTSLLQGIVRDNLADDFKNFNGGFSVGVTLSPADGKMFAANLIDAISRLRHAGAVKHVLIAGTPAQRRAISEEPGAADLGPGALELLANLNRVRAHEMENQTQLPNAVRPGGSAQNNELLVPIELLEDHGDLSVADLEMLEAVSVFMQLAAGAVIARDAGSGSTPEEIRGKLNQLLQVKVAGKNIAEIDEDILNAVFQSREEGFRLSQRGLLGILKVLQSQYDTITAMSVSA